MSIKTKLLGALVTCVAVLGTPSAQARVPGERWMRYADPAEAGFDAAALEAARETWEALPSSAFLVIADGAVVAAWGDVERRFMCHSVRKSFLSALFGVYWDRGEIELNKTLADLGIDDEPDPLLASETRARILDLLKARSGVFHPAAYAGRTDSRPRGSEGPGRYFAYNNWDFNTLAAILKQETGADVFEAFDEHFGAPLGMQDWRTSDGYYHYERDKSRYPAYPFRMSARDAARFGLLFAREGVWGDARILSRDWVKRSTALYSVDSDAIGYGLLWWVLREPRFARHGMVAALGVGNQMIAALPESDLVIVNRANTYDGERTPTGEMLALVEAVLAARTGEPAASPRLVAIEDAPADPRRTTASADALRELTGELTVYPDNAREMTTAVARAADGHLVAVFPQAGTFALYLQPDGTLLQEDSERVFHVLRDPSGAVAGIAAPGGIVGRALAAYVAGDRAGAEAFLALLPADRAADVALAEALMLALDGERDRAAESVRRLAASGDASRVEIDVNVEGYRFLAAGDAATARVLFELNTVAFPTAFNAWDSLGEAEFELGELEAALASYRRSLELNAANDNAGAMIARIEAELAGR